MRGRVVKALVLVSGLLLFALGGQYARATDESFSDLLQSFKDSLGTIGEVLDRVDKGYVSDSDAANQILGTLNDANQIYRNLTLNLSKTRFEASTVDEYDDSLVDFHAATLALNGVYVAFLASKESKHSQLPLARKFITMAGEEWEKHLIGPSYDGTQLILSVPTLSENPDYGWSTVKEHSLGILRSFTEDIENGCVLYWLEGSPPFQIQYLSGLLLALALSSETDEQAEYVHGWACILGAFYGMRFGCREYKPSVAFLMREGMELWAR